MITLAAAEAFVQEVREVRHASTHASVGRVLVLGTGRSRHGATRRPWRRLWATGPATVRWRRRS